MTTRIDPQTAAKISLIIKACRERGVDPVAALDLAGYLRHSSQQQRDRERVIWQIHQAISEASPTTLGDGIVPATPADMKRCILQAIERMTQ